MEDETSQPPLAGFGSDSMRAIELATGEAARLGHERIGTEHLLLGLLAAREGGAVAALNRAGATLPAARSKVGEAVGSSPAQGDGSRTLTPRAERALRRAARFSHEQHAPEVSAGHVLLGVLDVEGRAGQVLRGLGVDIDALRASIEARSSPASVRAQAPLRHAPGSCPSCGASLDSDLVFRVVSARGEAGGARDALVFSCGNCGLVLGVR